ncbi:MAG: ACT domain-containing protein [Deferribacteraceae bacterium]|jgi:hypothetical protein|nr:ACT domain-containing protein [Deferribacteraceae bacterium]
MNIRQISIFVENKHGRLFEVSKLLGENGINLKALYLADTTDFGVIRLIVSDPDKAYSVLKTNGFTVGKNEVIVVSIPDVAGGLAALLEIININSINIEYMYAFAGGGESATLVFRFNNTEAAAEALNSAGIELLQENDLL